MSAFFRIPSQSNPYPKEQKYYVHSLLKILRKVTVLMHVFVFTPLRRWDLLDSMYWFYLPYSPVVYSYYIRINISIGTTNRPTAWILDSRNAFHNTNVPIHEIFCVSTPPYYLDWFLISHPNVPLNRDEGQFCLQWMNGIQGEKPAGRQWNWILDAVVTIIKYNKLTIDYVVYIKVISDGIVSYLTVSTDDVLNTIKNDTEFTELRRVLKRFLG